ncbi:hypothetical protein [Streptomyces plumbiresistens]|uniref:Uncharacterized protein n=1 Tax=Streptomyces plumbiresistens TaxID=511811 RepID=A0ABP7SA46_9ACTN
MQQDQLIVEDLTPKRLEQASWGAEAVNTETAMSIQGSIASTAQAAA